MDSVYLASMPMGYRFIDMTRTAAPWNRLARPKTLALAGSLFVATQLAAQPAPTPSVANQIRFEHLTSESGLSQNTVFTIEQDRKGFMWFGTKVGLNRYDGYGFKIYTHDPYDPSTLSESFIRVVHEDRDGILWIGTNLGGLNRFDPATDTITHFRHDPDDPTSLSDDDVRAIHQDREGTLWVGTQGGGLNRFAPETGTFLRSSHRPEDATSLSHYDVRTILSDRHGRLWIGTFGSGLNLLEPAPTPDGQPTFRHFEHDPERDDSLSDNRIRAIVEDTEGHLWIGTNGGLDRFDPERGTFTRYHHDPAAPDSLSDNRIRAIYQDSAQRLWIGTRNGLNVFVPQSDTFIRYLRDPEDPLSLSGESAYSIFEDSSGGLWVGTYNGGVNRFDPTAESFVQFRHDPDDVNSLSRDEVSALHADASGQLWVGTYGGGLNRFDQASGNFTRYRHDPGDPGSLSDDRVSCLLRDQTGTLWVGMYDNGLSRFDVAAETFVHYRHDPAADTSLSRDYVRSLFEDAAGRLWIGTQGGGLNRFDPADETFVRYQNDPQTPTSLSHDSVFAINQSAAGHLWIGTYGGGLNRFDPDSGTFTAYRHDPQISTSLSHDAVSSILEDRSGRLWIGTYGGGLNQFDPERETFAHYVETQELAENTVLGILEDPLERLWLATNRGLIRFDPATGSWASYDTRDGLQDVEFNPGSYAASPWGEMFFGGNSGFNAFYPERFVDNAFVPQVVLTSFKIFETPSQGARSSSYVEAIELGHTDNFFSFEFAALSFRRPDKNRYLFMLEGLDEDWIDPGSRRYASYTKVPPGEYVFRVKGSNNDGRWNEQGAAVRIAIRPPWWKTPAFYLLEALLVSGLIAGAFRMQRRRLKRHEAAALQALDLRRKQQELASTEQAARELEEKNQLLEEKNQQILAAQTQLVQSEKMASLGQLVAGVAHEINNPVGFITSGLSSLRRDFERLGDFVPEEQRDAHFTKISKRLATVIDVIGEGASRTSEIVKSLRTFSRQGQAEVKTVDLNQSLESTLSLLQNLTRNRIQVVRNFAELPPVQCYASQINQVFMNLLVNGIQAIDGHGTLTITTTVVDENHVGVAIRDTGCGMLPEVQQKIFDPFFTTKPVGEGTGLGLSISHGILETHHATLELDSRPGEGTEFSITLPIRIQAPADPPPQVFA